MINDLAPWPPVGYHLPTQEQPARARPADAAPPAPPQADVVGNLARAQKARAQKARTRVHRESALDSAIRAICAIPDSQRRAEGYDALAAATGHPLDAIVRRAWWLRQEVPDE